MHKWTMSDASTARLSHEDTAPVRQGEPAAVVDDLEAARIRASARTLLFGRDEPVRLGRLELVGRVGAGGMGEVFTARDAELGRLVAVKLIRPDSDGTDAAARFAREARSMARLTHPNVVRIYDVGRFGSRVYITMEYVQGTTLLAWLEAAPRAWREVLARFVLAGRGLAAAHRTGLVHRDFKPANVLVADDGRVLVADFGLAWARSDGADADETMTAVSVSEGSAPSLQGAAMLVTSPGNVMGTPGYMSPEQLRAAPVDERSDLFSFCVALYEALFGVQPFDGMSALARLGSIEAGRLNPPARKVKIPGGVMRALAQGLAADPSRRPASMDVLLARLERAAGRPRRVATVMVAVAATLVTGVAAAAARPFAAADPCADAGAEIDAVWNDERARAVATAFAATGLPYAGAAAERVKARLDVYVADWRDAAGDTCAARQVRRPSSSLVDLQVACLGRREQAVRALVDAFVVADATTIPQAVDSVAALPEISACDDAEALVRTLRPPADPETAKAVARVREQLARADAQQRTGHDREALKITEEALVATLDDEPVRAEALAQRGRVLAGLGELVAAEKSLLDAAELAEATRHDELAADVWIDLMRLANRHLVDPGRGESWMPRARAAQRRLGDQPARRVHVLMQQGLLHYFQRRHAESGRALRAALELEESHGRDALMLAKLAHLLANTLEAEGRLEDARLTYGHALEQMEAALGPDHPEFARLVYDFGTFLTTVGELDPASAKLQQALAISTRAYGRAHHNNGRVHIGLGQVALHRGEFAEAAAHGEAAAQIFREVLPAEHPDHVDALLMAGTARFFAGELDAALAAFVAAQAKQRSVATPDPVVEAVIATNVAETQLARTDLNAARSGFAEAERLLDAAASDDADLRARVLTGRGRIALAEDDAAAALSQLEAALELRQRLPDDPLALAELHEALRSAHAAGERR